MKYALYNSIIEHAHRLNAVSGDTIREMFPTIPLETLSSIVSQEYTRKMKKTHYKHHIPATMRFYYNSYLKMSKTAVRHGWTILDLAEKHYLAPSLMARIILEQHYEATGANVNRQQITKLLKDSCLIEDSQLSCDIQLCAIYDDNYGPLAETVKFSFGHEYEVKLKKHLHDLKIPFLDEEQLRIQGYDKTPDVKLQIPIAINGSVINWIESKASFGDPDNHKTYLKEQFWSYWNRFGAGLVIYWFGFIDDLDQHSEKGILMRDSFPSEDEIQRMDPESLSDPAWLNPQTDAEKL